MNKKIARSIVSMFAMIIPAISFAATTKTLKDLIVVLVSYIDLALKALMGFAVLMFVWYIIQYFIRGGASKERAEAAQYLMWSVFGFFVILSFWGIVNILVGTFGLGTAADNARTWGSISNIFPSI